MSGRCQSSRQETLCFNTQEWLETSFGRPYSVAGFGNAFKDWCKEAGATEHELMAMFGWEDANQAWIYTRKAAQKKMAISGAAKVHGQGGGIVPQPLPPDKNTNKINVL
jgi:hypothetical protein